MRIFSIGFFCLPIVVCAQFSGVDDFNDDAIDLVRWLPFDASGSASLEERNQRLEFESSGAGIEWQYQAWSNVSYDEDFEVTFRVANTTVPAADDEFAGIGIEIYPSDSAITRLNVRLGSYFFEGFGASRDILSSFLSESESGTLSTPAFPVQPVFSFPKAAALRVAFDSNNKVFSVYYDANPTDGVQWTELSTFGVDGDTDGVNNLNFNLSEGGAFSVLVYARSDNYDAEFGELVLDDFQAVQGDLSSPTATVVEAAAVNFSTQLGESYTVMRSTDLSADPAFAAVTLVGENGTYRIAAESEQGVVTVTGTGSVIQILDPNLSTYEKAFYKIVVQ
jgi:hypothetical protein